MQSMKNNKFQYSKMLPIATGLLFIAITIPCFIFPIDSSIAMTTIGITGSVFGSSIIFYLRKAQTENSYKIRLSLYQEATKQRLFYNSNMMKLRKKYELDDYLVQEIENQNNLMDDAFENLNSETNRALDDATTPIELQN